MRPSFLHVASADLSCMSSWEYGVLMQGLLELEWVRYISHILKILEMTRVTIAFAVGAHTRLYPTAVDLSRP